MDADTKQALTHPSLKLIGGAGAIVIVAGVAIYALTHRQSASATSGAGTNPVDGSSVGTYAPTSFSLYTTTPTSATSAPAGSTSTSSPGGSTSSSSGSGSKTTPKKPGKTTRPTRTTGHPRKTATTSPKSPGGGAKLTTAATHAGGSSSSASSKSSAGRLPGSTRSAAVQLNTAGSANNPGANLAGGVLGAIGSFFGIGQ